MIRAAKLDSDLYEEVEHDQRATGQAAIVVVGTSIAAAIGSAFTGDLAYIIILPIAALVGWAAFAWLTYFIGTSRWCREVVETYSLDPRLIERSTMIKRQNVPWALSGILLVLAMIALGGASDPGANISNSADWVVPHRLLAIGATCWIGWAFLQQVGLVGRHTELIEEILGLVEEMREGKGSEPAGSD